MKREGQPRRTNELPGCIGTAEHKSFALENNSTARKKCKCSTCWILHSDYQILQEELKSTQKSIANCKSDTNKILDKIQKLETFFQ